MGGLLRNRDVGEVMSLTAMNVTAVFMQVPKGYVAFVGVLPCANTQGSTPYVPGPIFSRCADYALYCFAIVSRLSGA